MKRKQAVKKERAPLNDSGLMPVRLEAKELEMMDDYQTQTGLSKSYIIRRCVRYALERFIQNKVDILTLRDKQGED